MIRSATIRVTLGDTVFLIDPLLSARGTWPDFVGTVNAETPNPTVDLPMSIDAVLADVDAVLLTYLHEDHWDAAARRVLPKYLPVFVNDEAARKNVREAGFRNVEVLAPQTLFQDVRLSPMLSQHGTDKAMATLTLGTTMGILLGRPGCRSVYVVGDSVWRPFVSEQTRRHRPGVIVLNTGNAVSTEIPESIIMGSRDFLRAYEEAPDAARSFPKTVKRSISAECEDLSPRSRTA